MTSCPRPAHPVLLNALLAVAALGSGGAGAQRPGPEQILLPVEEVEVTGAWSVLTGEGDAARVLQDLTQDLSFNDGAQSVVLGPASPGAALTVRLKGGAPPRGTRSGDHLIHVWARTPGEAGALRVELMQGGMRLWRSPVVSAGAEFEETVLPVPQAAALNITDYSDLRLRFVAQGGPFLLTKAYLEVGEDRAPDFGARDVPMFAAEVSITQYEIDTGSRGVTWMEYGGDGPNDFTAWCSALDQSTGRPVRVNGERGVFFSRVGSPDRAPQIGRTSNGSFAVLMNSEGYIVTCDIDEESPENSVVTLWSGPQLDPEADDPLARSVRAGIFATKDFTQSDRIVMYQRRRPQALGGYQLVLVNLDRDPLEHVEVQDPPAPPIGRLDGIFLSSQRSLSGTPIWYWGCFPSAAPGASLGVCRTDISSWPDFEVTQVIEEEEDVLFGWPLLGEDGRERWIANYIPVDAPLPGQGVPGLRLYVQDEPKWVAEEDYTVFSELLTPSFKIPGRGQSPEVAGPDEDGRYYVVYSTHDLADAVGPFDMSAYAKILVAEIGKPQSSVVLSRKQNHQVQSEPEPFILNGKLAIAYSETRNGPIRDFSTADLEERLILLERNEE